MKITILGPAHPYRGGLASIMEIMARTFLRRGDEVLIRTFTLQYPSLLFPGKSQTVTTPPPADLHISRCVHTVNPFNWWRVGRQIRRDRPDFVLLKYWTPFMAPLFRHHRSFGAPQRPYEGALPDRQRRAARTPPDRQDLQPLLPAHGRWLRLHVRAGPPRAGGLHPGSGALLAASPLRELR